MAWEWFETYKTRLTPKHAKKLNDWLETRLFPEIGKIPVTQIEPQHLLDAVRLYGRRGHIETAHKLMQLCGQVMRYARITGGVKYDVASGLTEAMMEPKHKHFPAITKPKEVGRLMRDIFPVEVIDTQLAHKEPDSVRLAYNRAQYMEERRKMMRARADWLDATRSKA